MANPNQLSLFDQPKERQDGTAELPHTGQEPTPQDPKAAMDMLRYRIEFYDARYWNDETPAVPDGEYDRLKEQLRKLETDHPGLADPDSPTRRVGGIVSADLDHVEHDPPMLGPDNAFSREQLAAWWTRMTQALPGRDLEAVAELKIDGLAVKVTYVDGRLQSASTRGTGQYGEDVTHNARTIRNLPLRLTGAAPDFVEVRGEVYMPKSELRRLNGERVDRGQPAYANTRNAAAGAMRQTNPAVAHERGLLIWTYGMAAEAGPHPADSHEAALERMAEWGLPVNRERRRCTSVDDAAAYYDEMAARKNDLDYDVDGMVIKLDSLTFRRRVGEASHTPRWAVAWKFAAEEATTELRGISLSPGRFGKITPVAELEPVEIKGVTVRRASLHNEDYILRNDIRVGDTVLVQRAGDVIPQVVRPVGADPERAPARFAMPEQCPHCAGPVGHDDEAAHWCTNDERPARLPEQLRHFASRDVMDIEGLGDQRCRDLVEAGLVNNVDGIYFVTKDQLAGLPRMGARSAEKLRRSIDGAKARSMDRVLNGLQIYRLGNDISKALAERCQTVEEAAQLTLQQLMDMDQIGEVRAQAVVDGFALPRVRRTMDLLHQAGVSMENTDAEPEGEARSGEPGTEDVPGSARVGWPMRDMTVLTTGKVEKMTRREVQSAVAFMGGSVAGSFSRKVSLVVYGEKPGENLKRAEDAGTPTMHQREFAKLLKMARQARGEG